MIITHKWKTSSRQQSHWGYKPALSAAPLSRSRWLTKNELKGIFGSPLSIRLREHCTFDFSACLLACFWFLLYQSFVHTLRLLILWLKISLLGTCVSLHLHIDFKLFLALFFLLFVLTYSCLFVFVMPFLFLLLFFRCLFSKKRQIGYGSTWEGRRVESQRNGGGTAIRIYSIKK